MLELSRAASTALEQSNSLGYVKLTKSLEDLGKVIADQGPSSPTCFNPPQYDGFGVPLAYVWDTRSAQLRSTLTRTLILAHLTGNMEIIFAAKAAEECFLVVSQRIHYVEVICRRKLNWA